MASSMRINGMTITGNNISMNNGKIYVDGKEWKGDGEKHEKIIVEVITQDPKRKLKLDVKCNSEVNVYGDIDGKVDGTNITCAGNIRGNVDGTNVTCGDIGGDVDGTNVTCGDVGGDIDASKVSRR